MLQGIDQIIPRIPSQRVMEVTMGEATMMMMKMIIMEVEDAEGAKEIILLTPVAPVAPLMIWWTQEKKAKKMLSNVRW
jgi:hypothetical protein